VVAEKLRAALAEPSAAPSNKQVSKADAAKAEAQKAEGLKPVAPTILATPAQPLRVEGNAAVAPPPVLDAKPADSTLTPPSIFIGRPVPLAEFTAETWPIIFPQLTLTGVTRSIASHCALHSVQGEMCKLLLDTQHAALFNEEHRKRIEQSLADYFGKALRVTIETGAPSSETPAARRLRLEDERKLAAVRDFTHDPAVQALVERFGAEILYDSITSLSLPPQ
jgi:DNA polymerase-3 subunit gamma/tau